MSNSDILTQVKNRARQWLEGNFDEETKKQVNYLLENDEKELIESFYKDLEFGTGGLRGIMGVGTNRMNIYTVAMATQGLCNYMKKNFDDHQQLKVAIAYDSRNNGPLFADTAAKVFSANGMKVYLFDGLRPTPELSFAIRHLECHSGIVLTASHNPKEYNGYKAYWQDGGQIISPHDTNIVEEVRKISSIEEVKFARAGVETIADDDQIEIIGDEIDRIYIRQISSLSLAPEAIENNSDLRIVYTPIHGTGVKLVPDALKKFGFKQIYSVPEQDVPDGDFPTVKSPNPENAEALEMAIEKARQVDAGLVMATDPDSDRVGIAVRNKKGKFVLLNGNQTGAILIYYLIKKWDELGKLSGNEYVVKTIVTTELIADICEKHGVDCYNVLTGFKYIADIIKKNYGKRKFIGGGEESYGYLAGEFVRDKDAVMSCALIAEVAAWAQQQGKTLYDVLVDISFEYGLYKEALKNVVKKGKEGAEEIQKMMSDYRQRPPKTLNGQKVVRIKDYFTGDEKDIVSGNVSTIDLPTSNVLQFFTEDGSKISIRPSGTEPKIKFYFGVKGNLQSKSDFVSELEKLDKKIKAIIEDLSI